MEATLQEFLDHAPVMLRRPDGEILYWTDGCRELFGYTAEEAVGRDANELLRTITPKDPSLLQAKLLGEGEWTGRLQQTTKDGRTLWTLAVRRLREGQENAGPLVVEQNTDITDYVKLEEQRNLLTRELEHRVKNLLSVAQSLARRSYPGAPEEQHMKFEQRLAALGEANRLLREGSWDEVSLRELVTEIARALGIDQRIRVDGPDVTIDSRQVTGLALALHELSTNAIKHGALSVEQGHAQVTWAIEADEGAVIVCWRELGGPAPSAPLRTGFGTRLIREGVAGQIGSPVDLRFEPTGVACEMRLSLPNASDPRFDHESSAVR